jgi:hypothetical protein
MLFEAYYKKTSNIDVNKGDGNDALEADNELKQRSANREFWVFGTQMSTVTVGENSFYLTISIEKASYLQRLSRFWVQII